MAEDGRLSPQPDEEDWVQIDDHVKYDRKHRLGGTRSSVYVGKFTNNAKTSIDVAVKFIRTKNRSMREAELLLKLKHPNVIKLHHCGGCKELDYDFYVAMEICEISLEELMIKNSGYCRKHCRDIFLSIIEGLKYVHDKGIVHRDINPSNILLNKDRHIVIADFGFSKESDDVHQLATCSDKVHGFFIPPEMLHGEKASAMGDLYSAGSVLFWLVTEGKHAYDLTIVDGRIQQTGVAKLKEVDTKFHHDYELAKDLISQLLQYDPEHRIGYSDIVHHALFLSDSDKTELVRKLYTALENLPNYQNGGKKKKSIKQYLNEPAEGVTGIDWSLELELDDDEMEACNFIQISQKKEQAERLAEIEHDKRCTIYQIVQTEYSPRTTHDQTKGWIWSMFDAARSSFKKWTSGPDASQVHYNESAANAEDYLNNQAKTSGRKGKPYVFDSPFSLLRLIRNLTTHEKLQSKHTKLVLERVGLWKFINKRFPKFFLHVWDAVMRKPYFHEVKTLRSELKCSAKQRRICPLKDHYVHDDSEPEARADHEVVSTITQFVSVEVNNTFLSLHSSSVQVGSDSKIEEPQSSSSLSKHETQIKPILLAEMESSEEDCVDALDKFEPPQIQLGSHSEIEEPQPSREMGSSSEEDWVDAPDKFESPQTGPASEREEQQGIIVLDPRLTIPSSSSGANLEAGDTKIDEVGGDLKISGGLPPGHYEIRKVKGNVIVDEKSQGEGSATERSAC